MSLQKQFMGWCVIATFILAFLTEHGSAGDTASPSAMPADACGVQDVSKQGRPASAPLQIGPCFWVSDDATAASRSFSVPDFPSGQTLIAQSSSLNNAAENSGDPPGGKTRRSAKKDTEEILVQEGGVLIPKGTLVIEPSLNYVHIQNNRLAVKGYSIFNAILFGRFDVEKVRRNILTATLTSRYGITNRLQAELYVPYVYRTEKMIIPESIVMEEGNQDVSTSDSGLGDIGGSVNYHAILSRGNVPDVTLNFRFKSRSGTDPFELATETVAGREFLKELPTGTGFYGISSGITLVKVSDPLVFYGSLAYAYNIERDVGTIGKIDPGDSIEYNMGVATALNEKASLSFSFQNAFTDATTVEGEDLSDSELVSASLAMGVNYRLSPKCSIFGVVNVGLTDDTPDFQVQLNIPFTFKPF